MGNDNQKNIKKGEEEEEKEELYEHEEENKEKEEVNEGKKSFISLDLMIPKKEDSKFNLDIIWIDENVFNEENQFYFKILKEKFPNIKITTFNDLEEGFENILKLEFVTIFVIVSGRLYSQYYNKLKNNLNKIKCVPINIIFTSSNFKQILENNKPDKEQIISYDIQKSINNSFYNSGGVYDNYFEVAEYLNKFNSNFT